MKPKKLEVVKCKVCDYEWESRKAKPKACPEYKSRNWNKGGTK